MTAAPHSQLVERVTDAVVSEMKRQNLAEDKDVARTVCRVLVGVYGIAEARLIAQAALAACHADELARMLAQSATELDTAAELAIGQGLTGMAGIFTDAANRNRALLAKLEGRS